MYRFFIIGALVLFAHPRTAYAQHATSVNVPAGTQIQMYVPGDVDSEAVHAGRAFYARASLDVVVDGVIVVRKGAPAQGTIRDAKRAADVKGTSLMLSFDWVYAVDGTKIMLADKAAGQFGQGAASATASETSTLPSSGIAGFFGFGSAVTRDAVNVRTSAPSN